MILKLVPTVGLTSILIPSGHVLRLCLLKETEEEVMKNGAEQANKVHGMQDHLISCSSPMNVDGRSMMFKDIVMIKPYYVVHERYTSKRGETRD